MRSRLSPSTIYTYLAFVAGCATSPHVAPPEVPTVLQPPAGQILYLEALATGVQIYECAQKTDLTYEWAFKAPEASLVSRSGHPLGKHYAGPTWESIDGSTVVGVIKARDPGPKNSAIPWLLLAAKATLAQARSVQPRAFSALRRLAASRRPNRVRAVTSSRLPKCRIKPPIISTDRNECW